MRFTSCLFAISASALSTLVGSVPVPINNAPKVQDLHIGVETNATQIIGGDKLLVTQTVVTTVTSIQAPLPSSSALPKIDGIVEFLPPHMTPSSMPSPISVIPSATPSVALDAAALFFPVGPSDPLPPVSSLPAVSPSTSTPAPLPAESNFSNLSENVTTPLNANDTVPSLPVSSAPLSSALPSVTSVSSSLPSATSLSSSLPIPSVPPMHVVPQVMAYYPDWAGPDFPPEKIDFSRFDWIDFAFALPNEQYDLTWDDSGATDLLKRLVTAAHANDKKVKLSIGGWTGAKYFSPAVANDVNRVVFVNNIVKVYNQYNLDGIDIDWEYPGQPGQEGNIWTHDDTSNYLLFLILLRSRLPPTARISAATQVVPFADQNGQPLKDVTPFASVLDWILIMNYDVWGSDSNPGPNAPLSNACGNSTQPDANADSAITAWTAAGMPTNKIVLGVPSYAYISKSNATRLRTRAELDIEGNEITVDVADSTSSSVSPGLVPLQNPVTLKNDNGGSDNGQIQFAQLVEQFVLTYPGFLGAGGFTRHWDECSSTPYLTSEIAGQVVTYDDPQSLQMKAKLARTRGLLGVNMFDIHGDTEHWDLVDAVRAGLGLP